MKFPLRDTLAASHVGVVTVAFLLLWSLDSAFWFLWELFSRGALFLIKAVAILDIPYHSATLTSSERVRLVMTISYLFGALLWLGLSWSVSRWIYGTGPLRSLNNVGRRISRRTNA